MNGSSLMTLDWTVLSRTATGTVASGWLFHRFAKPAVLSPRHGGPFREAAFNSSGSIQPFLNQGMSLTERGTLMVAPFRLSSFLVLRAEGAALVFSTTSSAMSWPFSTAFTAPALVLEAAFEAPFFAFEPALFAAFVAFEAVFFAALAPLAAALLAAEVVAEAPFAAAWTFLATAADKPALWRSLTLALATLATVLYFAETNFFAVAAPTPGRDVSSLGLSFPAMCSPDVCCLCPNLNLPHQEVGPPYRFLHEKRHPALTMEGLLPDGARPRRRLGPDKANDAWIVGENINAHNSCHSQSIEWEEVVGRLRIGEEGL